MWTNRLHLNPPPGVLVREDALSDEDRMSVWLGLMVGKRYEQRARELPFLKPGALAALAASDIWAAVLEPGNPLDAIGKLLGEGGTA